MDIIKELHELKVQYTEEMKKAQAKCEVVDDLIAKFAYVETPFEETPEVEEQEVETCVSVEE